MVQCVGVCWSVLKCVILLRALTILEHSGMCVAVCCSVLQRDTACCSVLQCGAVCYSVLQCDAVSCSVFECAEVCHLAACLDNSSTLKYV